VPGSAAQGFPRQARLIRAKEFERALKRPDFTARAGPLRLNAVFNRMPSARLGLVVGRRAVSRAHARNRIKRIIRDRFRRIRTELPAVDIVVRVVAPVQRAELHRRIDELFADLVRKAGGPQGSSQERE
jgi:ribonuclease P protein component